MFNCTKIPYSELLEEKCSVALKIVMFLLSRALLHTVIYFSFLQALVLLLSASDVMVLHCSLYALIGLAQRSV